MISHKEVADMLGVSDRRVFQLVDEGIIGTVAPAKYDEVDCARAYIKFIKDGFNAEKARLTKEQADGQALKNEQTRRDTAPVIILETALNKVAVQINSVLDSLPLQIKKRSPKLTGRDIEAIRKEIVKVQNAASETTLDFTDFAGSSKSSG